MSDQANMEVTNEEQQEKQETSIPVKPQKDTWLDVDHFDVIILGTGLTESFLAGALARVGKTVLHFDKNDFYGGYCSSFNLQAFDNLIHQGVNKTAPNTTIPASTPHKIIINNTSQSKTTSEPLYASSNAPALDAFNCVSGSYVPMTDLLKESRQYNIDVIPKIFYSNGGEVSMLISSGVARYLEFKVVENTYLYRDNAFQQVPCSKGDLFKSKYISLLEKRALSKFLQTMKQLVENKESLNLSEFENFIDFLNNQGLNEKLQQFVLYSIALLQRNQTKEDPTNLVKCTEGIQSLEKYIASLGKYGTTAFIAQLYGVSEMPQAFCRLCAVYGGLYILRRTVTELRTQPADSSVRYTSLLDTEGQELRSEYFVAGLDYLPQHTQATTKISRCVCITNRPLTGDEQQIFAVIPPNQLNNKNAIYVFQFSSDLSVCARGKYLVHFVTESVQSTAEQDLKHVVEAVLDATQPSNSNDTQPMPTQDETKPSEQATQNTESEPSTSAEPQETANVKPSVLYYAYFNLVTKSIRSGDNNNNSTSGHKVAENIFVCSEPDVSVDCEIHLREAKQIFHQLYPDLPFLPKVPNPEDIVWEETPEDAPQSPGFDF